MKKLRFLFVICGVALLASCASYQQTASMAGYDPTIKTNVVADLDMNNTKPVTATIKTKTLFWVIPLVLNGHKYTKTGNGYRYMNLREQQALYKATKDANVDLILNPEFTSESHSYFFGIFKKTSTTVKGTGVNVKGLRQVNP